MVTMFFFCCSCLLLFPIPNILGNRIKENNVCSSFKDYQTIKTNKNCWYNPDVNAKPHNIAKRYGYRLEDHKVITPDGYILTLHHLVKMNRNYRGPPVFLHHGICLTSTSWMLKGKQSPAFQLVASGFDVWLANGRGNDFSMKHVNLSISDPKFWDFSFHEMACYDVPAAINYIRDKISHRQKITFIAHSMGTTISYIYSSIHAEHARTNVNMLISIAPVAYLGHVKTWLPELTPYLDLVQRETRNLGFHGSGQYPNIRRLVKNFCFFYPLISLCQLITETIVGTSLEQLEPEVLPLFFRRFPGSFSMKTLVHFAQEAMSGGNFQWYDYGEQENVMKYNSPKPRQYDVERIQVPVYLIYGEKDLISTEEDVFKLFMNLKSPKTMKLFRGNKNEVFAHNDFLYSKHISDFCNFLSDILNNITLDNFVHKMGDT